MNDKRKARTKADQILDIVERMTMAELGEFAGVLVARNAWAAQKFHSDLESAIEAQEEEE